MHPVLEGVLSLLLFLYYIIEAIVLFFVPARFRCKNVSNQIVLITGAGSGLGRLMAMRFAKLGCRLVLWDINGKAVDETAIQCRELGAQANSYVCDVGKPDAVKDVAKKVAAEMGEVDILINNAGIVSGKKLLDCPDEMIEKTIQVNSVAHFWTTKAFLPTMLSRNSGHIVTIASLAGHSGVSGLVDYCTSKFAAVGFDDSLRAELWSRNKHGVHMTVVCPSLINTGMFDGCQDTLTPLIPLLDQENVADKIVQAVLTNQTMLVLPGSLALALAIKHLLPVKAGMLLADFMGTSNFMDGFRGRVKQD